MATICQIAGIACSSGLASTAHEVIISGDLGKLDIQSPSFRYSCIMSIIGIVLLVLGWYIMYILDKDKSDLGDQ